MYGTLRVQFGRVAGYKDRGTWKIVLKFVLQMPINGVRNIGDFLCEGVRGSAYCSPTVSIEQCCKSKDPKAVQQFIFTSYE